MSTMRIGYGLPAANDTLRSILDAGGIGTLTTDHAASSHGLPVVIDEHGRALGPGEVTEIQAHTYVETDDEAGRDIHRGIKPEEVALLEAARRAGYVVR